jgi:hypothetical protein
MAASQTGARGTSEVFFLDIAVSLKVGADISNASGPRGSDGLNTVDATPTHGPTHAQDEPRKTPQQLPLFFP